MYRILGLDHNVTTCERCGKTRLSKTVVLAHQTLPGVLHFGTDCAARALLGSSSPRHMAEVEAQAAGDSRQIALF